MCTDADGLLNIRRKYSEQTSVLMELEREKVRTLHLQTHNSSFLCKAFTHAQTCTRGVSQTVQGRSRTFQHLSQTLPWGCGRPVVWGGCLLSFPLQAMHNKQVCGAELTWCRGLLDMEHAAVRQSHQPADVKCTHFFSFFSFLKSFSSAESLKLTRSWCAAKSAFLACVTVSACTRHYLCPPLYECT